MPELIVLVVFITMLWFIQYREQKKIIFNIHKNMGKRIMFFSLGIIVVCVFWPTTTVNQGEIIIFALLLASLGVFEEGLGENRLVKIGLIDVPYHSFTSFSIEDYSNDQSFVTLYKSKKGQEVSFVVDEKKEVLTSFLAKKILTRREKVSEQVKVLGDVK